MLLFRNVRLFLSCCAQLVAVLCHSADVFKDNLAKAKVHQRKMQEHVTIFIFKLKSYLYFQYLMSTNFALQ